MNTILYSKNKDKIIVNELKINENEFIKYNKNKINELIEKDRPNLVSNVLYIKKDKLYTKNTFKSKISLLKQTKTFYNEKKYNLTYCYPIIPKYFDSKTNDFVGQNKNDYDISKANLNKIPDKKELELLRNILNSHAYFYYLNDVKLAIRLDNELTMLYKLLYLKDNNLLSKDEINKEEYKKIFSLDYKEELSLSTFYDLINTYNPYLNDKDIDKNISKDEEKIKKIKLILK